MRGGVTDACPLCGREMPKGLRSKHHLKTRRTDRHLIAKICVDCHRVVHSLFENRELRAGIDTIEAIRDHPRFASALTFIQKQPMGTVRTAAKKRRR